MTIKTSKEISSHGGVYGDNHLKERDRTSVNIQRNNKRNKGVGFVFRFSLSFKFFMILFFCFILLFFICLFAFLYILLFYFDSLLEGEIFYKTYSFQHFGKI